MLGTARLRTEYSTNHFMQIARDGWALLLYEFTSGGAVRLFGRDQSRLQNTGTAGPDKSWGKNKSVNERSSESLMRLGK